MLEISMAQLSDKRAVLRLLNQVTLDLIEKGNRQWHYPWSKTTITQQVSLQKCYVIKRANRLIGSFSLTSRTEYGGIQLPEKSLILSELALEPRMQGLGLSASVFEYCIELSEQNHLSLYIASPTKNSKLAHLFKTFNFELWERSTEIDLFRYH